MTRRIGVWVGLGVFVAAVAACSSDANTGDPGATSSSSSSSSASGGGGVSSSSASASGGSTGTAGAGGTGAGGNGQTVVRLIAIGDTGEGNADQHCVADAMSVKCLQDGCDGVLLAGDNFYSSQGVNAGGVEDENDPQWMEKFELPYDRAGLNGLPFYAVLGNHDYAPPPLDFISGGSPDAQIAYSSLPVGDGNQDGFRHSDKWTMPARYYDLELGNGMVHLFGMDGQDASQTQLDDMSQRVSDSSATWKLVFNHFPRFTSGDHQDDMDYLNFLLGLSGPDLYELLQGIYCNADVFLAGHDHDREYMTAGQDSSCPNTHFIVSGAGAKVDTASHATMSHQAYFNNQIEGFFYLVFEADKITLESYDMSTDPNDCGAAGMAAPAFQATITK